MNQPVFLGCHKGFVAVAQVGVGGWFVNWIHKPSLRIQTPPDRIGLRVPIPSEKNRNVRVLGHTWILREWSFLDLQGVSIFGVPIFLSIFHKNPAGST